MVARMFWDPMLARQKLGKSMHKRGVHDYHSKTSLATESGGEADVRRMGTQGLPEKAKFMSKIEKVCRIAAKKPSHGESAGSIYICLLLPSSPLPSL